MSQPDVVKNELEETNSVVESMLIDGIGSNGACRHWDGEEITSNECDLNVPKRELESNNPLVVKNNIGDNSKLSKRQLKRLKKREKWLSLLSEKRMKERIKLKLKRQQARENNITLGPSRRELKDHKMLTSKCRVKVALDFSFDHYMNNKDIAKCISQVLRCYSYNRRAENPLQFYVVNFNGHSKDVMGKHNGYKNWDVFFHQETYLDLFSKDSIIYLTSDSDNVLDSIDENKVYVIGALVDHNSLKGLCHKTAVEQGINHAQLPIEKYVDMKTRKVLPISHVFDIMLRVSNGASWKDAFLEVLPQRKGATGKDPDKTDVTSR